MKRRNSVLEKIYEQDYRLKDFNEKLTGMSGPIADHWLKCKMYPNDRNVSHWKKEIADFVDVLDVPVLKEFGEKKYKTVYKYFIEDSSWADSDMTANTWLKRRMTRFEERYGKTREIVNGDELVEFMVQIAKYVSEEENTYERDLKFL